VKMVSDENDAPSWDHDRQSPISAVSISPNARWLAAASGEDGLVFLWDLQKLSAPRALVVEHGSAQLIFSPDSSRLIGICGKTLYKWELSTNDPPQMMHFWHSWNSEPMIHVGPMAISPDGNSLVIAAQWQLRGLLANNAHDSADASPVMRQLGSASCLELCNVQWLGATCSPGHSRSRAIDRVLALQFENNCRNVYLWPTI